MRRRSLLAALGLAPLAREKRKGTRVGWEANNVFPLLIVVSGAANTGLFIYNGTPALGNPPVIAATAPGLTTDPSGNALTSAGIWLKDVIIVGPSGGSQIELAPVANIPWGGGQLQSAAEFLTTDANQKMPGLQGGLLFNAGLANQQMALVLTAPDATGNAYALVLSADSDDATIKASLALGTVTTDGISETFTSLATFDSSGNLTVPAAFSYSATSQQQTVTFTTVGSNNWVAPAGVTSVKAECWSGGGGGAGGNSNNNTGGGAGGGGEYAAEAALVVTAGNTYHPTVGAGGAHGAAGVSGSAGGNSTMAGDAVTVTANGGSGGGQAGGGGGGGHGSANTTHHNGGVGGTGGAGVQGGGGGSSASPTAVGTAGGAGTGGSGGAGGTIPNGGSGGNGGSGAGSGHAGGVPGGGGGGGGLANGVGGNGASGQVRLTFTPAIPALVCALAGVAGSDPLTSTAFIKGLTLGAGAALNIQTGLTPAAPSSGSDLFSLGNVLREITSHGFAGVLGMEQKADFTTFTVTQASQQSITHTYSVPANDADVGAHYELYASGDGTQGTTAQGLTFNALFGGNAGGTSMTIPTTALPISEAFNWEARAELFCVTTGAGATWWLRLTVTVSANTAPTTTNCITVTHSGLTTIAVDSTVAENFLIQAGWVSTTGAPTIQGRLSSFSRKA